MDEQEIKERILRLETELAEARLQLEGAGSSRTLSLEVRPVADRAEIEQVSEKLRSLPGVIQVRPVSTELDLTIYSLFIDEDAFDLTPLLNNGTRLTYADRSRISLELTH